MIIVFSLIMLTTLALSINAFHVSPGKNSDLLIVTILLLLSVLACTFFSLKFGLLNTALISPALDFPLAVWVYQMWLKQKQQWKLLVVAGLITQLSLHIGLIVMWKDNILTPELLRVYVSEINFILGVVLTALGWVGLTNSIGKHEQRKLLHTSESKQASWRNFIKLRG